MPATPVDQLWQIASTRWTQIGAKSPDLAPALALQQALLRISIGASVRIEDADIPGVPVEAMPGKWRRGLPAFRNEIVPIPQHLKDGLTALCGILSEGGAGDSALHIGRAVAAGDIDAGSLLSVSLARNHKAIRTSALHMGFSPDLLWLIGDLASAPLAHHLRSRLAAAGLDLTGWARGYCPCCGSWPVFIEVLPGSRALRCSYCAASWELYARRCVYCGNAGEDFVEAAPDLADKSRRVELCRACGGYTKVIQGASPTPAPLLAIEDLATMDLDQGAMARGYGRPELQDLDAIDPPSGCP